MTIVLSLKNGEKYLSSFLDSLAGQSYQDFKVLVRDDGSSDDSAALAEKYPFVYFHPSSGSPLGVTGSYSLLLRDAPAGPVMFADQDDIWHPEKVSSALQAMNKAQCEFGDTVPLLLHSDLHVCDSDGKRIADSFMKYQKLSPERCSFREQIVQNHITGCTMIINQALRDRLCFPFPEETICHDWYLGIAAAAFGKIIFMENAHIDYRQHGNNVFGARKYTLFSVLKHLGSGRELLRHKLLLTQKQAGAFCRQYAGCLEPEQLALAAAWADISEKAKILRLWDCLRFGFTKNTWSRTIGLWWAV